MVAMGQRRSGKSIGGNGRYFADGSVFIGPPDRDAVSRAQMPSGLGWRGHCSTEGWILCARGAQQQAAANKRERGLRTGPGADGGETYSAHGANVIGIPAAPQEAPIRPRSMRRWWHNSCAMGFSFRRPLSFAGGARQYKPLWKDASLLVVCVFFAGTASKLMGQDANWDLQNYHFYIPWAWLTGRLYAWDIAAAQLQSYHNPLPDIPFYLMVAADWRPRIIAFVLAIPAGIAAFFLLKLLPLLFRDLPQRERWFATIGAAIIGLTAAMGRGVLGSTMNDWFGTALIVAAIWLIVRGLAHGPSAPLATGALLVLGRPLRPRHRYEDDVRGVPRRAVRRAPVARYIAASAGVARGPGSFCLRHCGACRNRHRGGALDVVIVEAISQPDFSVRKRLVQVAVVGRLRCADASLRSAHVHGLARIPVQAGVLRP